jgi:hypothetical protein
VSGVANSPINWSTVQNAIKDWFAAQTGLTVVWSKQRGLVEPDTPHGALELLSGPRPVHRDAVLRAKSQDGTTIERNVCGNREFTVSCKVFTGSALPGEHAIAYCERAQTSLRFPSVIKTLRAAGVAIVSTAGVVDLSKVYAEWVSIAALDVVFRVASNVADTAVPPIETATLTISTNDTVSGQKLTVTSTIDT